MTCRHESFSVQFIFGGESLMAYGKKKGKKGKGGKAC